MEHGRPLRFKTRHGILTGREFGASGGKAVFHFHGQYSSSLEGLFFHAAAEQASLRLVSLDRPGFGDSPARETCTMDEWAGQVLEIAGELGLERFGVLAVSAGAKYGLALGLAVPERARGVVLASSFGPVDETASLRRAAPRVRWAIGLYQSAPWLARPAAGLSAAALRLAVDSMLRVYALLGPATERRALQRDGAREIVAAILESSVKQGAAGVDTEFHLMTRPWGLDLGALKVPVEMWHGEEDIIAPMPMAEALAAALPACRLHRVPDSGHVSLLAEHAGEILSAF